MTPSTPRPGASLPTTPLAGSFAASAATAAAWAARPACSPQPRLSPMPPSRSTCTAGLPGLPRYLPRHIGLDLRAARLGPESRVGRRHPRPVRSPHCSQDARWEGPRGASSAGGRAPAGVRSFASSLQGRLKAREAAFLQATLLPAPSPHLLLPRPPCLPALTPSRLSVVLFHLPSAHPRDPPVEI